MLPQELGLVRVLSVFHTIYMGQLNRLSAWYNFVNLVRQMEREVEMVRTVADRLGLVEQLFTPAGELSGGQQQRTAVGRALNQGSDILIGDESVSAVDEYQSRNVQESINEHHDTVLLTMHDIDLAITYTARIVGLRVGAIVIDQPTAGMVFLNLDDLYRI